MVSPKCDILRQMTLKIKKFISTMFSINCLFKEIQLHTCQCVFCAPESDDQRSETATDAVYTGEEPTGRC